MTFPRWRSFRYKPLESQPKRRNTIGAVRRPRPQSCALYLTTSSSPDRDVHLRDPSAGTFVDNGAVCNGAAVSENIPATDTTEVDFSSVQTQQRNRRTTGLGWTFSLRNRLSSLRRRDGSRRLRCSPSPPPLPYAEEDSVEELKDTTSKVPATDAELELLLQDAWSSVFAVGEVTYGGFMRKKQALEYRRKMAELRHHYKLKLAEIHQREATFLQELLSHDESTPLLLADQLTIPVELKRALREVQSSGKFDKLRVELKRETATAVLALQSRYPAVVAQQKHHFSEKTTRPVSCHWPSRTIVYCNPHTEVAQSGSMVGIFDGFYATENFCDELHHSEHEPGLEYSL